MLSAIKRTLRRSTQTTLYKRDIAIMKSLLLLLFCHSATALFKVPESDALAFNGDAPYVIRHGCREMPAVKTWTERYLIDNGKRSEIKYFINDIYMETGIESTTRHKGTLRDFLVEKRQHAYILEQQTSELSEDLFSDLLYDHNEYATSEFLQVGYTGTGSHFHLHESGDYLLCIVSGKKTMLFVDPFDNGLPIHPILLNATNASFVSSLHELTLQDQETNLRVHKAILNEGDLAYIPPWWYHNTVNRGLTIAVTDVFYRRDISYIFKSSEGYKFIVPILKRMIRTAKVSIRRFFSSFSS